MLRQTLAAALVVTLAVLPVSLSTSSLAAAHPFAQQEPQQVVAKPDKTTLIKTLKTFYELLVNNRLEEAAKMAILPEGFEPDQLLSVIRQRELSPEGIAILERDAVFGTVMERFPKRGKALLERSGVDAADCYGFQHTNKNATGEVLAKWDGKAFKLFRIDDVGQLPSDENDVDDSAKQAPEKIAPAKMAPEAIDSAKTAPESPKDRPLVMSKDDVVKNLGRWMAAVEAEPKNVKAKVVLAMAQYKLENTPAAWRLLVESYQLDPREAGAVTGMRNVALKFRKMGVFTVGVPPETVQGILGEPTSTVKLSGNGNRFVYGFFAVDFLDGRLRRTVDLIGTKAIMFEPAHIVTLGLPPGWNCADRHVDRSTSRAIYLPAGQTVSNWTEQFDLQRFVFQQEITIPQAVALMKKSLERSYPKMESKTLVSDETTSIVANVLPDADPAQTRHQLVRFMKSGDNEIHRIAITVISEEQPDEKTQQQWLKIFQAAELKSAAPPADSK
ncbi:MAG: hypothetical protein AAFN77_06670 [Planctomycetota bacterium]